MILYFDTETTGLRPGRIIQLAYILETKNDIVAKNFFFSVPFIEPSATAVHGFTVEDVNRLSDGKKFADFADEIQKDFAESKLVVSHNFNFDFMFISEEFSKTDLTFRYNKSLDTMRYFTTILKLPRDGKSGYKYPKLSELADFADVYPFEVERFVKNYFGTNNSTAHDARYDTASMYMAVKNCRESFVDLDNYISDFLD